MERILADNLRKAKLSQVNTEEKTYKEFVKGKVRPKDRTEEEKKAKKQKGKS